MKIFKYHRCYGGVYIIIINVFKSLALYLNGKRNYLIKSILNSNTNQILTKTVYFGHWAPISEKKHIKIQHKSGDFYYHIPVDLTLGHKRLTKDWKCLTTWPWVNEYYLFELPYNLEDIISIQLDPLRYTGDIDLDNNSYPLKSKTLEVIGVEKLYNLD